MWRRVPRLTLTAVLALAVLVVGHNLVFVLTYGPAYAHALARTGHDSRWEDTVRAVLAATGALATVAAARLVYLVSLVRRTTRGRPGAELSARSYGRTLLTLWINLFAVALPLFALQENLERWGAGLGLPGLAVLGSSGAAGPVPVFLFVSLIVAAVAALFRWGIATVEAQIAAGRNAARPSAAQPRRRLPTDPDRPVLSILGRNLAGRAPPAPLSV